MDSIRHIGRPRIGSPVTRSHFMMFSISKPHMLSALGQGKDVGTKLVQKRGNLTANLTRMMILQCS